MKFNSVETLASAVEAWCGENEVLPASGQASVGISPRNVRYYRSLGLLDGPAAEADAPYGEKHFLQLAAIRILQARGQPLARIQQLLMGRSLEDLRRVRREGLRELASAAPTGISLAPTSESWRLSTIDRSWLIVSRDGATPTDAQLAAIREILAAPASRVPNPLRRT